jgi:DNA/RNA endonuclease YhcR with UshA esterase domain
MVSPHLTSGRSARITSLPVLFLLGAALVAGCGDKEELPKATPIGEARGQDTGSTAIIEGAVTVPPGAFVSALGDEGFAVQDDTGGIYVKLAQKPTFGLGAKVRVSGTLDEQNKLRILKAETVDVTLLEGVKEISSKPLSTGGVNESSEGQLARVSGNVSQAFQDDSPYGYKLYINVGSGEVQVFVHVSAGFDKARLQALTVGQRITVVGLVAQYETTYEVAPRQPSDLTTN